MTIPTTPTECRAEQERVLKLLSNADTPESWYYQPGWGLQKHNADGLGLIAGQSDFAKHGDLLLLEAAPTLARQYAELLDAHAEALEREAALLEALKILHKGWERDGILLYAQETVTEADGTATWLDRECRVEHDTLRRCAVELRAILPAPPAPASAEGGEG